MQNDIETQVASRPPKLAPMLGFDPEFKSYPDYLFQVGHAIWEARGLASAARKYIHHQLIRRSALGMSFGPDGVASEAANTLRMFPDLQQLNEDVMWTGTPQRGFLGSQRILNKGRYQNAGKYGPASGQYLTYRTMIDSYAKSNKISDQWVVQDTGAILRQLGVDLGTWIEDIKPFIDPEYAPFTPQKDETGPYTSVGDPSEWGEVQRNILTSIMSGDGSIIRAQYDPACELAYPGGTSGSGWSDAEAFWFGLRSAMPDANCKIHHVIGAEDALMPARAAIRWSLTGKHAGWGALGTPSGVHLHVMGITHVEFGPYGLRREWTLYDEAAIAMQIALAQS